MAPKRSHAPLLARRGKKLQYVQAAIGESSVQNGPVGNYHYHIDSQRSSGYSQYPTLDQNFQHSFVPYPPVFPIPTQHRINHPQSAQGQGPGPMSDHQGAYTQSGERQVPSYPVDINGHEPARIFRPIPGISVRHNLEGMLCAIDSSLRAEYNVRRTPVVGEAIDRMLVVFELLNMERDGHGADLVTDRGVAGIDLTNNDHTKMSNGWCERLWQASSGVRWIEKEILASMNAAWQREQASHDAVRGRHTLPPQATPDAAFHSTNVHPVFNAMQEAQEHRVQIETFASASHHKDKIGPVPGHGTADLKMSKTLPNLPVANTSPTSSTAPVDESIGETAVAESQSSTDMPQTPTPPAAVSAIQRAREKERPRVCLPLKKVSAASASTIPSERSE